MASAEQKVMFIGNCPAGPVIILKDGRTLLDRGTNIDSFSDVSDLRSAIDDQSQWSPVEDVQSANA